MKKFLTLLFPFILYACSNQEFPESVIVQNVVCNASPETPLCIVEPVVSIGQKLPVPYSVENMRRALAALVAADSTGSPSSDGARNLIPEELRCMQAPDIQATHLYIKIAPANANELSTLKSDTTLVLFPYPLDCEISGEGTLPETAADINHETGLVTLNAPLHALYTTIPVGKALPDGLGYEILEELYFPSEDASLSEAAQAMLIAQTQKMVGGKAARNLVVGPTTSWYPSGTIRVYDTSLKRYVGVPKVKVCVSDGLLVRTAYTDKNGAFRISLPSLGPVNYSVEWSTNEFRVVSAAMNTAAYVGPRKKGAWNLDIAQGGEFFGYATVARALYTHFYGAGYKFDRTQYMSRPIVLMYRHMNSIGNLGYFDFCFDTKPNERSVAIVIYGFDPWGGAHSSEDLLGATFHELGHCAMYYYTKELGKDYLTYEDNVHESWAVFVAWYTLDAEYKALGYTIYDYVYIHVTSPGNPIQTICYEVPNDYNKQVFNKEIFEGTSDYRLYTPLFVDLVDDTNQKEYYDKFEPHWGIVVPDDKLCIDPSQFALLQKILYNSYHFGDIFRNLSENRVKLGITDAALNTYHSFYNYI